MRRRALVALGLMAFALGCGSSGPGSGDDDDDATSREDGAPSAAGQSQDAGSSPADATTHDAAGAKDAAPDSPFDAATDASGSSPEDAATGGEDASADGSGEAPEAGAADAGGTGADSAADAANAVDATGTADTGGGVEDATVEDAPADSALMADARDAGEGATDARNDAEDAAPADARDDVEDATVAEAAGDADMEDATVTDGAGSSGDAMASDGAGSTGDAGSVEAGAPGGDAEADGGSCSAGASFTGGLTNYTQTAANACGQPWPDAWSVDTGFPAVAINTALFDEGSAVSACNKCVSVTGTTGATATFVVVDECPGFSNSIWCQANHLDIDGIASYNLVENGQPGSIDNSPGNPIAAPYPGPVSWKYVPCPWTAGITYLFEPNGLSGGTYFYLALNVYHTRYGLQTVRYRSGGTWVDLQPRTDDQMGNVDGNFVINGVAIPNPIDLQVVDEHGQVIEDDAIAWSAPTSTFQSSKQFPTCN
jgi:hypothetical protein